MSDTVVKITNLVKRYKELVALDNFYSEKKRRSLWPARSERVGQEYDHELHTLASCL